MSNKKNGKQYIGLGLGLGLLFGAVFRNIPMGMLLGLAAGGILKKKKG